MCLLNMCFLLLFKVIAVCDCAHDYIPLPGDTEPNISSLPPRTGKSSMGRRGAATSLLQKASASSQERGSKEGKTQDGKIEDKK